MCFVHFMAPQLMIVDNLDINCISLFPFETKWKDGKGEKEEGSRVTRKEKAEHSREELRD
jgi:hypothetical protein